MRQRLLVSRKHRAAFFPLCPPSVLFGKLIRTLLRTEPVTTSVALEGRVCLHEYVYLDVYVGGYGCTYELIPPVLFLIFSTGNYLSTRNVQESHDAHLLHAWLHF